MRKSIMMISTALLALAVQGCGGAGGGAAAPAQPTPGAAGQPASPAPDAAQPAEQPTTAANPGDKVLFGTVTDDKGNALPNVKIYVTRSDGSESVGAESDADGQFELALPLGTYSFEARPEGYQPYREEHVDISMVEILPMRLKSAGGAASGTSGLDALQSYSDALSLSYDGTSGGKAVKGTVSQQRVIQRDGQQSSSVVSYQGDPFGDVDPSFDAAEYRIGATYYNATGKGEKASCFESSEPHLLLGMFTPLSIVGEEKEYGPSLGDETVNGIAATRHRIERQQPSGATYTADVWLAKDGGYIVKSEGEAVYAQPVIRADLSIGIIPFSLEKGTITWSYSLSDVNSPLSVEKPAGCTKL